MTQFKVGDKSWDLTLNVGAVRRVLSAAQVDLFEVGTAAALSHSVTNLADVLWVLVEAQAKERHMSRDDFEAGLAGEAIDHAYDALMGALVGFFPPSRRAWLEAAVKRSKELNQQGTAAMLTMASPPPTSGG
jgi:hypothetical protein